MAEITKEQMNLICAAKDLHKHIKLDISWFSDPMKELLSTVDALIESEKPKECRPPNNKPGWYWLKTEPESTETIRFFNGTHWYDFNYVGALHPEYMYKHNYFRYLRPVA